MYQLIPYLSVSSGLFDTWLSFIHLWQRLTVLWDWPIISRSYLDSSYPCISQCITQLIIVELCCRDSPARLIVINSGEILNGLNFIIDSASPANGTYFICVLMIFIQPRLYSSLKFSETEFTQCRSSAVEVVRPKSKNTQDRKERTWRVKSLSFEHMPKMTTACGTGYLYPRHKHRPIFMPADSTRDRYDEP
jgi:hypothetical protein